MNVIGTFAKKKNWKSLNSENVVTGQSSFKSPGLSVSTVTPT